MPRRRSVGSLSTPKVIFVQEPSPEQLRHDLLLFERNISDYNKPLLHSKEYIIEDVKKTFRLERDPVTGDKWPALSERADRVPRYGMLQRKKTRRAMYRSVTAKNNYGISKQGVWFNQRTVPDYAGLHQQDDRIPKKTITTSDIQTRMIKIHKDSIKAGELPPKGSILIARAKNELEDELKKKGEIPQRRFMGVSGLASNQIQKTFDAWASDAIIIYRRGGQMVKARRAGRA